MLNRLLLLCLPVLLGADAPQAGPPGPTTRPLAWGPIQGKIEYGAVLRQTGVYAPGRPIHFELFVRNPTYQIVGVSFSSEKAVYTPPAVEDANGQSVKVLPPTVRLMGAWALVRYRLNPDEIRRVGSATLVFDPNFVQDRQTDRGRLHCVALAGPGTYKVTYPNTAPVHVEVRPE